MSGHKPWSEIQHKKDTMTTKRVLVLNSKSDNYYYPADTEEQIQESALKIVKLHVDQEYYYNPGKFEDTWGYKHEGFDKVLEPDEIDKLATDEERVDARRLRKRYLTDKEDHEQLIAFRKRVEKCLEEKDGKAALDIINERQDHEYEGWSIERLES